MYILFLPSVGLYVSCLPFAYARGETSWHKGKNTHTHCILKDIHMHALHNYACMDSPQNRMGLSAFVNCTQFEQLTNVGSEQKRF
jgi:hypothetical protein